MKRLLFPVLSIMCLLLCAAMSALWIRSHATTDQIDFMLHGDQWELVSKRGNVSVSNEPQIQAEELKRSGEISKAWTAYQNAGDTYDTVIGKYIRTFADQRDDDPIFSELRNARELVIRANEIRYKVDDKYRVRPPDIVSRSMPLALPIFLLLIPPTIWLGILMRGRVFTIASATSLVMCVEVITVKHCEWGYVVGPPVGLERFPRQPEPTGFGLAVDGLWIPAALFLAIAPFVWVMMKARRKQTPGNCFICGYDLRATPRRCPECGTVTITNP